MKYMCVCEVAQMCPTLCDPVDWSPPGSSIHGIFQARVLEWVAISFSRGSSWPSAEELFNVPKRKEAVTWFMEKYIYKTNLVESWKYNAIGHEFNVNESTIYTK